MKEVPEVFDSERHMGIYCFLDESGVDRRFKIGNNDKAHCADEGEMEDG